MSDDTREALEELRQMEIKRQLEEYISNALRLCNLEHADGK